MAYIRRRGNSWELRDKSRGDKRISLGPISEDQAREILQAYEKKKAELRRDGKMLHLDNSRVSLGKFRDEYIRERRGHIADTSLKRYEVALKMLAEGVGDRFLLSRLTARRIARWAGQRRAAGVSPAGVNADLRHIKSALRTAEDWDYIAAAPKIKMLKAPRPLPRAIPQADIDRILSHELRPERSRLWRFLAWSGCRRAEALGLQWQDIIWEPRPMARVLGKGGRERLLPLFPPAIEALELWWPRQESGPVFVFLTRRRGQRQAQWQTIKPDTATHWWQAIAKAASYPARLHDLRHSYATNLMAAGISPRFVQEILGHANLATTESYSRGAGAAISNLYDDIWGHVGGTLRVIR